MLGLEVGQDSLPFKPRSLLHHVLSLSLDGFEPRAEGCPHTAEKIVGCCGQVEEERATM